MRIVAAFLALSRGPFDWCRQGLFKRKAVSADALPESLVGNPIFFSQLGQSPLAPPERKPLRVMGRSFDARRKTSLSSQGFFNRPVQQIQPLGYGLALQAHLIGPLLERLSAVAKSKPAVVRSVILLFDPRCPTAVSGFVPPVVVDPVNGVSGRGRFAHIFKKILKIAPPVTDRCVGVLPVAQQAPNLVNTRFRAAPRMSMLHGTMIQRASRLCKHGALALFLGLSSIAANAAEINDLNVTDASNIARFPENQSPSSINDGARALEGLLARFYNDLNCSNDTTGSSNAYDLAADQTISAYYDGLIVCFTANFSNTGAATLSVDTVGDAAIKKNHDVALASGDIESGGQYLVVYDGTNFQLLSEVANQATSVVTTQGDIIRGDSGGAEERLALGASTYVFQSDGTDAVWDEVPISGQTAVTALDFGADDLLVYDDSATAIRKVAIQYASRVAQVVVTEGTTEQSVTATVDFDDTTPQQSSDGIQVTGITRAITPLNASSTLEISVQIPIALTVAGQRTAILIYEDSDEDAIAAVVYAAGSNQTEEFISHTWYVSAASTSARTYKLFAGVSSGTAYINRGYSGSLFNGLLTTSLTVKEILP